MECNSEDWKIDNYHAIHRSGVKIWIGNGILGYHIEKPTYQDLGWIDKFKLHKQIKNLKKNNTNNLFQKTDIVKFT